MPSVAHPSIATLREQHEAAWITVWNSTISADDEREKWIVARIVDAEIAGRTLINALTACAACAEHTASAASNQIES